MKKKLLKIFIPIFKKLREKIVQKKSRFKGFYKGKVGFQNGKLTV